MAGSKQITIAEPYRAGAITFHVSLRVSERLESVALQAIVEMSTADARELIEDVAQACAKAEAAPADERDGEAEDDPETGGRQDTVPKELLTSAMAEYNLTPEQVADLVRVGPHGFKGWFRPEGSAASTRLRRQTIELLYLKLRLPKRYLSTALPPEETAPEVLLRSAMTKHGLTESAVADLVRVSPYTVRGWLRPRGKMGANTPRRSAIELLYLKLGVPEKQVKAALPPELRD